MSDDLHTGDEAADDVIHDGNSGGDDTGTETEERFTQAEWEKRLKGRFDRIRQQTREQVEAELTERLAREAAEKQGDFEKLYQEQKQEAEDLRAKVKSLELRDIKLKALEKHGLSDSLIDRLRGDTEDELMADAEELARGYKRPIAPETDAGNTIIPQPRAKAQAEENLEDPKHWNLPA